METEQISEAVQDLDAKPQGPELTDDQAASQIEDRLRQGGMVEDEPGDENTGYDVADDMELSPAKPFEPNTQAANYLQQAHNQILQEAQQYDKDVAATNWEELREDDPGEFAARRAEFNERRAALEQKNRELRSAYQNVEAEEQSRQSQYLQEHLALENEQLVRAIPGWRDSTRRAAEQGEVARYLRDDFGYSPDELNGVMDHRLIVIARKALLHDKGKHAKPTATARARKPRHKPEHGVMGEKVPSWNDYKSQLSKQDQDTLRDRPNSQDALAIRLSRII